MPRPTNKEELLKASETNFSNLMKLVDGMTSEEMNTPFDFSGDEKKKEAHWKRDKNVRDVFIHLIKWHELALNWVNNNKSGKNTPFLMEGYNWKTYGEMNALFWKKGQEEEFLSSKKELVSTHNKIMEMIKGMSNDELFLRNYYSWSGNNAIGAYLVSVTSSHYDWAMKKIKAHIKKVHDK